MNKKHYFMNRKAGINKNLKHFRNMELRRKMEELLAILNCYPDRTYFTIKNFAQQMLIMDLIDHLLIDYQHDINFFREFKQTFQIAWNLGLINFNRLHDHVNALPTEGEEYYIKNSNNNTELLCEALDY